MKSNIILNALISWLLLNLSPLILAEELNTAFPQTYVVNTDLSYIHIYTGKAGLGSAASHKHLVAITDIEGEILIHEDESANASLSMRPENFLVDDDQQREIAIDERYQAPVAEWIKTGTKKNMNGEKLLNAAEYPEIQVVIQMDELESGQTAFPLTIQLKSNEIEYQAPGTLLIEQRRLSVQGEFEMTHEDLGLKPFSAGGGLMRVAKKLRFYFYIQAGLLNDSDQS